MLTLLAAKITAHIHRHAHQPGLDGFLEVQTVEILEDAKKDFLRCIVSVVVTAENSHGDVHDAAFVSADDVLEGCRVATENKPNDLRNVGGL
jgi:hypothetical protein